MQFQPPSHFWALQAQKVPSFSGRPAHCSSDRDCRQEMAHLTFLPTAEIVG